MSLIKREPSPAQSSASQANGRHSNGPSSEWGRAISSRNLPNSRAFSKIVAQSMEEIGEKPGDFELMHAGLAEAMAPRDGWEAAWVQDIAILRWRLERLQRAEVGIVALRRRQLKNRRVRAADPPTGSAAIQLNNLAAMCGFTGIPDSVMKFQQVIAILTQLRDIARIEDLDDDVTMYFSLLYGRAIGPRGAVLKAQFESMKKYKEGHPEAGLEVRKSLVAELSQEIERYEQLQSLYAAEHLEADPLQEDAELLLPHQELDEIIRYETHLEDQIERKLRQFYARRREPVLRNVETTMAVVEESGAEELARATATAGA